MTSPFPDEDGYELWLRYRQVQDPTRLNEYRQALASIFLPGTSRVLAAARDELCRGLSGLLGQAVKPEPELSAAGLVAGTPESSQTIAELGLDAEFDALGDEGFLITRRELAGRERIVIAALRDVGVLYGIFRLLRHLQLYLPLGALSVSERPKIKLRALNHWDNLDGTVERGYAGASLWRWSELPEHLDRRYTDYARALSSLGLNATALTNVNADARVLTREFLLKVAALANVFRAYGIAVFLTARFSAPIELGGLLTADPKDPDVAAWWQEKVREIYQIIPDFGGFLVKANSEGQPGPQDYGRSHAEGANLLARALAPHGGSVIWRAFVYDDAAREDDAVPNDRAKQAYTEFVPHDGTLLDNALLQVKNGAIDFQPREPFHPLFGAMSKTPLMLEVQLTQEYLGFASHLVYLAPMFEEVLRADTFAKGEGSSVARVVDGSLFQLQRSGMAAVSNVGDDRNWCGHPFAQANWYAFGRLAWDPDASSAELAEEWLRLTFSHDDAFVATIKPLMLGSREACVNYMTPLGLHHLMAKSHHYGPGPWVRDGRADWTSVYYHRATARGIGFDRSPTGSNAVSQYRPERVERWADAKTCPEELLLWFHHVPWDTQLASGRSLWDELCHRYTQGVGAVKEMRHSWQQVASFIDRARFEHVARLLETQEREAQWWRDGCLAYFQSISRRPFPPGIEPPEHSLAFYEAIEHHNVPGTPWPH